MASSGSEDGEEFTGRHSEAPGRHSEPPREHGRSTQPPRPEGEFDPRGSFDRILPELLRRGLLAGRGPLEKLPRELTSALISQFGDIRSGVVKAVAQEVGRFLREADIASELRKVLHGLDVEASVRLRFHKREDGSLDPKVEVDGKVDSEHGRTKGS